MCSTGRRQSTDARTRPWRKRAPVSFLELAEKPTAPGGHNPRWDNAPPRLSEGVWLIAFGILGGKAISRNLRQNMQRTMNKEAVPTSTCKPNAVDTTFISNRYRPPGQKSSRKIQPVRNPYRLPLSGRVRLRAPQAVKARAKEPLCPYHAGPWSHS